MTIKGLLWLALILAVSVGLALMGHFDEGHVIFVYPPYRLDASFNFFILATIASFFIFYFLIRLTRQIWKMPQRIMAYRARKKATRAYEAINESLNFFYAGHFSHAEKVARKAKKLPKNTESASLIGAMAAHHSNEFVRRDEWLNDIQSQQWQEAKLATEAKMQLDNHQPKKALALLTQLEATGHHTAYSQKIALKIHQQLNNWDMVLHFVKQLQKLDHLSEDKAQRYKQEAYTHLLLSARDNPEVLNHIWKSFPADDRFSPETAYIAVNALIELKEYLAARDMIEQALAKQWHTKLIERYSDCAGDNPLPLIARAEKWLEKYPEDAALLYTLGRLCTMQKLWGKAQLFLDSALKFSNDADALLNGAIHLALAQYFEVQDQKDKAYFHYRQSALKLVYDLTTRR